MNRAELIEKLKQNEKPFGLLEEVEQELMKELNEKEKLDWFDGHLWDDDKFWYLDLKETFRISHDYTEPQPEAEYEVCEVKWVNDDSYVSHGYNFYLLSRWRPLETAPRFKFAGVQFLGQRHKEVWYMGISGFIGSDGTVWILEDIEDNEVNSKPATPARVRFLKD